VGCGYLRSWAISQNMIAILHVTDLHFGKRSVEVFSNKPELARSIAAAVTEPWQEAQERLLVISGDLVYQGNVAAFEQARQFIEALREVLELERDHVIICPGNHDIVHGEDPFGPLNRLIHRVTLQAHRTFANRTSFFAPIGGIEALVFNSAHTGNHEFGLVDLAPGALPELKDPQGLRIAIVHHNLLGIYERDESALRNAYPFLSYLSQNGVKLLLHGHQHAWQELPRGTLCLRLVGAGSLNFRSLGGTTNQFNLILAQGDDLRIFRYIWDSDTTLRSGIRGGWVAFP
jgi:DNA repair exonuclease SbcCD nuclease subunit